MAELNSAYISNGNLYLGFDDGDVINAGRVQGPPGPAGVQLLSGAGLPMPADGRPGDFWIDYQQWNLFGPKGERGWPQQGVSLAWQPDRYRGVIGMVENLAMRVQEIENTRTRWLGQYQTGVTYVKSDQVIDDGWLAIANQTTTESPAPYPIGDPFYFYQGAEPTVQQVAPSLILGNEYTFAENELLTGYRVLQTVIGNTYSLTAALDSGGTRYLEQLGTWTSELGGTFEVAVPARILKVGDVLALWITVREPDPTPTQFNGNWDYNKPNNEGVPLSGDINHSNRLSSSFRIHKTDNDGGDRSAELEGLVVGDLIDSPNLTWSIQAIIDNGTWMDFTVAPAQQDGSSSGTTNFVFSTNAPTPITHMRDPNYWVAPPVGVATVRGFISTGTLEDAVYSDDAFGVDILGQKASASTHWDLQTTI